VRRAGLIAVGALVALSIAGVTGWLVASRDDTAPVGVEEALDTFRDRGGTAAGRGESPVPEGVYVYTTRGFEKTDALAGVRHRYPRRSTVTVAAAPCGVRLTWRVLEGRSTEWTYCVTGDGWDLREQDERHTFFGRTERTTYVCNQTPLRRTTVEATSWNGSCSTGSTHEDVRVTTRGRESHVVQGRRVDAEHVSKESVFRGDIRGTARHDLWFDAASGVPIRIVMVSRTTTASPIGDVGYEEDVSLTLRSLEPRR
jgi:hypothetical protein